MREAREQKTSSICLLQEVKTHDAAKAPTKKQSKKGKESMRQKKEQIAGDGNQKNTIAVMCGKQGLVHLRVKGI